MKIITNSIAQIIFYSSIVFITSCSNEKNKVEDKIDLNTIIHDVETVVAIGKVKSAEGSTIISSNTSGIISKISINEGEQITKGQVIAVISNPFESIDNQLATSKLKTLQDLAEVTKKDLNQEKIQLEYLKDKLTSSKLLFAQGAETKENLLLDQTNYNKQRERVSALMAQLASNENQVNEQKLAIDKVNINSREYTIKAPTSGIISSLAIDPGQFINESQTLGEITNTNDLIIEAEVDELFADLVKPGQKVTLNSINTKKIVGEGEIIYTSPILANKSILYENANEAEDRRVRKIKVKPIQILNTLLINAKVECQIKTN